MNEVHFYDLPATTQHRCGVMLRNRMQCPKPASVAIVPDKSIEPIRETETYICIHHFSVERSINEDEGVKYIFHDPTGTETSERDKEYTPPQK